MLSDPEIIDRGQRASALLADPMFQNTVNDLSNYHMGAIAASAPGETGRVSRESHHLLHYALSEIGRQLSGYVAVAQETIAKLEALKEWAD